MQSLSDSKVETKLRNEAVRVLLVEDNGSDARLIQEHLKECSETFNTVHVERLHEALEALDKSNFDVVLLDLSLPDSTGLQTFAEVKVKAVKVPILVMSGFDDEALAVRAVREGAQDYLVKGKVEGEGLGRAIRYGIERKRAEEDLKSSLAEKEVLLKEVHHRVKNNMQVICSLLSLQARHISDPDLKNIFKESRNRILSMALVHEELYRSKDFTRIDFSAYTKSLLKSLYSSHGVNTDRLKSDFLLQPLSIGIERAIPLGLMVNEIVSGILRESASAESEHTLSVILGEKGRNEHRPYFY